MSGPGTPANSTYNTAVAMEFFRSVGRPKNFAKGRKIFSENQRGMPLLLMPNRMYLLLEGEVAIFAKDRPIGTVLPGQIFGEMASIDQGPRSATAVARSGCRVIGLDNWQLQTALGKKPEFALMLMSVMIGRLRESIGRIAASETPSGGGKRRESMPLRKELVADLVRSLGPATRMSYEAGHTILREGQAGALMYVVLKGSVAIQVGGSVVQNPIRCFFGKRASPMSETSISSRPASFALPNAFMMARRISRGESCANRSCTSCASSSGKSLPQSWPPRISP